MHRFLRRTLFAGTTAAAAALIAVTPAFAATSITVDNPNADGSYTAHSDSVSLVDTNTGARLACESSDAAGTILSGTYSLPHTFPNGVTSLAFNTCTGPLGAATATSNTLPYGLTIESYPGSQPDGTAANGVGYVGSVNVHVVNGFCEFDVTGDAPGYYLNSGDLVLDPDTPGVTLPDGPLTVSNASGCFGVVSNGDQPAFTADYAVTPPITVSG